MSQRILYHEIDESVNIKLDKSIRKETKEGGYNGLMTFGDKNDYPQKIERSINNSTSARAAANIFMKFAIGQGFENKEINNIIIGRDSKGASVTVKQLLRQAVYDLCYSNGFYVHTDWNIEQKIGNYKHIPFKDCRFSKPDDSGFASKVLVYDNWTKDSNFKRYDKKDIKDYSIFTTDEDSFKSQVKKQADGDIKKYKGQMFFSFFENNFFYPLSPFDSAFLEMDTEYQVSLFKNRTIRNGFLKKTLMRVSPPETEEARNEFLKLVKDWTGADGSQFLTIEDNALDQDGSVVEGSSALFDTVDSSMEPDLFQNWENESKDKIRLAWNVPQFFINPEAGLFGNSGELVVQMTNYYNSLTQDPRDFLSESFARLFKLSSNETLANNKNWKIKEFSLIKTERDGIINTDTTTGNKSNRL